MEREDPRVERTFLIADVRGYTRFTREHGDAAAARLAAAFAELARDAVEARSGDVLELRGDEALSVFTSPSQAARAALEFQALCAERYAEDPTLPLAVGIGIDAGEAVPVEGGFRGTALNMAARLCANAGAGQVLVSRRVADAIAGAEGLVLEHGGEATLKGFEGPVDLIEVRRVRPASALAPLEPAPATPFPPELDTSNPLVGRTHETHWLRGTWWQARRGDGRLVVVAGPPGIGKTRLAAELAQLVHERGDAVRYAGPSGTAMADAVAAVRATPESRSPTLLILDDLDALGDEVASELARRLDDVAVRPVLIVCTVHDPTRTPALGEVMTRADRDGDGHRALSPLDPDGVRRITETYVGAEIDEAPVESFVRTSGGLPARVHEVVSDWAREEVTRRMTVAAEWLEAGRTQRAADLAFANNVIGRRLSRLYTAEAVSAGQSVECPYMGLASFKDEDAERFFGREQLVGELAARTVAAGLLAVVGASGAGKTSVVAAGLVPSLRAGLLPGSDRWITASLRPGEHPMQAYAEVTQALPQGGERTALVIDQFEEAFALCADEVERAAFVAQLEERAADPERHIVIVVMRGDYYGHCAAYPTFRDLVTTNNVLVGTMSPDELRRAIELPARRVGFRVESGLLAALIDEAAERPGGLPLLSTALVELWQRADDGWLRLRHLEETGGVRGAVARLAERSYARLTPAQQDVARAALLRLVADEDDALTRRRVPMEEFDIERDPVTAAVLARLTEDRILIRDRDTIEVAHEALLREWPRLRAWIEEDATGRQLRRHVTAAANQWEAASRDPAELYRGARLSAALDWSTAHGGELNERERAFLNDSRLAAEHESERQRRTNRRLRGLLIGVAAFAVVALVAGSLALIQRGNAQRSADEARAQTIAADAQRLGALAAVETRPDLALLLAAEGYRLDPTPETRGSLFDTLMKYSSMLSVGEPTGGQILRVEASRDGQVFAVSDVAGRLVLFDGPSLTPLGEPLDLPFVREMAFAPDGRTLFVVGWTSDEFEDGLSLRAVDVASNAVSWIVPIPGDVGIDREEEGIIGDDLLRMWPDGSAVAWETDDRIHRYAVDDGAERGDPIRVLPFHDWYPLPGGRLLQFGEGHLRIEDLRSGRAIEDRQVAMPWTGASALSPDGTMLASSGWNGTSDAGIAVMNLATGDLQEMRSRHAGYVADVAFSPDGSVLASAGDDGGVFLWDVATGEGIETLVGHGPRLRGLAFVDDGRSLVSGGLDTTMIAWDIARDRSFVREAYRPGPECDGCSFPQVAPTPDGEHLTLLDGEFRVRFVDAETLEAAGSFPASIRDCCQPPAYSPDGAWLATLDPNTSTLWFRDAASGDPIRKLFVSEAEPSFPGQSAMDALAYSPDGTSIATNENNEVVVIDPRSGEVRARLAASDWVESVAFSPDAALLQAATDDGRVTVWDTSTFERIWTRRVSDDIAIGGDFSADGELLIVGDFDGGVHVLRARSGAPVRAAVRAHSAVVGSLTFSPDGSIFATSGVDGLTYLWDTRTGRRVGSPFDGTDAVMNAFSEDGSTLYVNSYSRIFSFPVDPELLIEHACTTAGRTITPTEWQRLLPDRPYEDPCGT